MQTCHIQQVDRLLSAATIRALLCLFAFVLLLVTTPHYAHADSGLINRSPVTIKEKPKTGLDRLADSLGDIVKSIDRIVAEPDEGETSEQLIISEPVTNRSVKSSPPVNTIAKPDPALVKPVEINTPPTPALALPATPTPVLKKASTRATVKIPTSETPQENSVISVDTTQNRISKPAFQKLSMTGEALKEDAKQWACVEDTRKGLIWEVKENDGGLRDKKHSYSWFNPEDEKLKGIADGGRCKGGIECDTNAYVQALNAQNFCGHSDWRLPTREEIQQLVELDNDKTKATINDELFPDTVPSWYWTSSSNENNPDYAWYVLFRNGISLNDLKQRPKHIRLVRTNKKA